MTRFAAAPSSWQIVPLRALLVERDERDRADREVLSVYRDLGVVPKEGRVDNFNKTPEHLSNYKAVYRGDVVINKMKAWQGSMALSQFDGIVSGDYLVCRVVGRVHPRFLHFALRAKNYVAEIASLSTGVRPAQWRLYWDDLKAMHIALPSMDDQVATARALDHETSRIDALISRKDTLKARLIEALEARIAQRFNDLLVSHSGAPIRRYAQVIFSSVDKLGREGERPVRLCNYTDVYHNEEIGSSLEFLDATANTQQISLLTLRRGDVLMTKDSETAEDIGITAHVSDDLVDVVCGYHLALLRPRPAELRGDYLYWATRSPSCRQQISSAGSGVTRFGLRVDAVRALMIPVPPVEDQLRIANELKRASSTSSRAIDALERQKALLRDYGQALVTDAATGELDVSRREG